MTDAILRGAARARRRPLVAGALSLLVPGLGQLYNGEPAKAVVFALLRALPGLVAAAAAVSDNAPSHLRVWSLAVGGCVAVWLAAPAEAAWASLRRRDFTPGAVNRAAVYVLAGALGTALFVGSIAALGSVLALERAGTDDMRPTIDRTSLLLVRRRAAVSAGDVVLARAESGRFLARVIASDGRRVTVRDGRLSVGGFELPVGVYSAEELARAGLANRAELFFETNGMREYPILLPAHDRRRAGMRWEPVAGAPPNAITLAFDDRTRGRVCFMVPRDALVGRVEGIVRGPSLRRSLALPWAERAAPTR